MNRNLIFCLAIGLYGGVLFANDLPSVQPAPTLMLGVKNVPITMNFKIPLVGISDPSMLFTNYSSRPLVIFYFSPKSPHARQIFPAVQKLINEFKPMGLSGLAISEGTVTKNDIRSFMVQNNASIPSCQDSAREFGKAYGNGYTPILYLVYKNGTIIRYTDVGDMTIIQLRAELQKIFPKK